jgi:kanamycin kinase
MAPLISGAPTVPVPLPAELESLVDGDPVECVWRNELGGLTFAVGGGTVPDRYVKWAAPGSALRGAASSALLAEAERLEWAAPWIRVPQVLDADPAGRWLLTAAIPGTSAVDPRWVAEPVIAARAMGRGLRALHDALPVEGCPFDWSVTVRVREAQDSGLELPAGLLAPPAVDRLVVAHGDACAPNTLLDAAGGFLAHVDLGRLGVADRWADLAIATYSLGFNFVPPDGVDLEQELLDAYGIERDDPRIHYYRALWDAT